MNPVTTPPSRFAPLFLGALLTSTASTVYAAQTAPTEPAADRGEVIVTAAKRSENVQNVPIAVSAIGGDTVSRSHLTQTDELVTRTPNLQLTSTVGDNTPIFALRGVSMSDYSLNQASPVATYYDEVYKGNFAFLGVAMYDLQRVEVLRGPQGTLYGKNTTGGAVNLISRAPKLGDTSGYLNVGYGNYNRIDANGAVNIPLADKAALRVAFTYATADGWFKQRVAGQPDLAGVNEYAVRASLLLQPSDGVKFVLRAATSYQNPFNYGVYATPESVNRIGLGPREIATDFNGRRHARTYALALTGTFRVADGLTVTSITSYDKGSLDFKEDTDGTAVHLFEIPYVDRASQIAQDLRLTSDWHGRFNFILGGYFNREKVFNDTTLEFGANPGLTAQDCINSGFSGCLFHNSFDQLKTSYAAYTDARFDLVGRLTLRGGLRFTHDTGRQYNFEADALGVDGVLAFNTIPHTTPATEQRFSTDNLSGKIGLDYKPTDGNLLYANYSRGYRARSFNAQAFFSPTELSTAAPEIIDAFEVGSKNRFADRTVTLNLAAFYYKYANQQFINVNATTGAQTLQNLPKSRIFGGEAELNIRASDALSVHGSLGLLSTKIEQGVVSGVDVSGHKLSNAPTANLSGGVDATVGRLAGGKLSAHGDVSYVSSQFFEVVNVPRLKQNGYALVGGHIDWESAGGRWNASVWAKNLTDTFYFTSRVDLLAGFGFDYNHLATPRTFGVTLGAKF